MSPLCISMLLSALRNACVPIQHSAATIPSSTDDGIFSYEGRDIRAHQQKSLSTYTGSVVDMLAAVVVLFRCCEKCSMRRLGVDVVSCSLLEDDDCRRVSAENVMGWDKLEVVSGAVVSAVRRVTRGLQSVLATITTCSSRLRVQRFESLFRRLNTSSPQAMVP